MSQEAALRSPEADILLLQKLRGVGPAFATVLTREVFYRSLEADLKRVELFQRVVLQLLCSAISEAQHVD